MKHQKQRQSTRGNWAKRKLDFIKQAQSEDKRWQFLQTCSTKTSQSTRTKSRQVINTTLQLRTRPDCHSDVTQDTRKKSTPENKMLKQKLAWFLNTAKQLDLKHWFFPLPLSFYPFPPPMSCVRIFFKYSCSNYICLILGPSSPTALAMKMVSTAEIGSEFLVKYALQVRPRNVKTKWEIGENLSYSDHFLNNRKVSCYKGIRKAA